MSTPTRHAAQLQRPMRSTAPTRPPKRSCSETRPSAAKMTIGTKGDEFYISGWKPVDVETKSPAPDR